MSYVDLEELKRKIAKGDTNIKELVDWDDLNQVEKFMILIKEIQAEAENGITHAIDSHVLGRQKTIAVLRSAFPIIANQGRKADIADLELERLLEMVTLKGKIDYCLGKLDTMLHKT